MKSILSSCKKAKLFLLLFIFLSVSKYPVAQTLDSSFGINGRQVVSANATHLFIRSAAAQDKKIIVAGYDDDEFGYYPLVHVWRFMKAGKLDNSFGVEGTVFLSGTGGYVLVQPDSKIVVAGNVFDDGGLLPHWEIFTQRLQPDGRLDSTFGTNGTTRIFFGNYGLGSRVRAIALRPDGKIIMTGTFFDQAGEKIALVQLRKNGGLDSNFGDNGVIYQSISELRWGLALKILPENKILAGFDAPHSKSDYQNCLLRYSPKGKIDTSFGSGGIILNRNAVQGGTTNLGLAVQEDGKIVEYVNNDSTNLLLRYNANGSVDKTFGIKGRVQTGLLPYAANLSLAIDADGKILINASSGFSIARYLPNGSRDTSFGVNGLVSVDFSDLFEGEPRIDLVLIQPNNKILGIGTVLGILGGNLDERLALARFNNTAVPGALNNSRLIAKQTEVSANKNTVVLYPNPVKDILHITGLNANTNYVLKIIDGAGTIISVKEVKGNFDYNVQQLGKGVYYLSIISGQKITTIKFVKD